MVSSALRSPFGLSPLYKLDRIVAPLLFSFPTHL